MPDHKLSVFKFEDIEVREREFLLVEGGKALPVEPKAFRVLLFLLRNPKRLVTKDEILNAVGNDCAASDNSLTRSVATLRRLLGDDSREPRFIATNCVSVLDEKYFVAQWLACMLPCQRFAASLTVCCA